MGKIKKFIVSQCCVCCAAPNKERKDNNKKEEVAIHDILQDKNGNGVGDKNGVHNPNYIKDEDHLSRPNASKEELKTPFRSRQVSDISELFRVPCGDDKSLSELVFEELEKSKSVESLDRLSQDNDQIVREETDAFVREADSESHSRSTARDINTNNSEKESNSTAQNNTSIINTSDVTEAQRSTEWRDKLKEDMLNDDLEFIDESTDDDLDDDVTEQSVGDPSAGVALSSTPCKSNDLGKVPEAPKNNFNEPSSKTPVDDKVKGASTLSTSSPSNVKSYEVPMVIDNGSYNLRVGWAGKFQPEKVVRNVIGHWRAQASEAWEETLGSNFVGEDAITRHSTLTLENPVEDGRVRNWKKLQGVWEHVIANQMEADMTQHPLIVTESLNVEKKHREKMIEILVESLRFPAVTLRNQAAMCTHAENRKVAVVVNSGYGLTEIVPVYEGYPLKYSARKLPVGGRQITNFLARLAQREKGSTFTSVPEIEIVNAIKERCAEVTIDGKPPSEFTEHEITLPDGNVVVLDREITRCVEPLFSPSLVGAASPGLPQLIKKTIEGTDPGVMESGDHQILLTGGNSKLKGLQARVQNNLNDMISGYTVHSSEVSDNAAWIGASILAQQSNFVSQCVTEEMYFERGANIVHAMCL